MNGRALKKSEVSWMLHILPLPKIVNYENRVVFISKKETKKQRKKINEMKQHEHSKGTLNTQQWR